MVEHVPPPRKGSLYIRPLLFGRRSILGVGPAPPKFMFLTYASPVGNYFNKGRAPLNLYAEDQSVRAFPGGVGGVKIFSNYGSVNGITTAVGVASVGSVTYKSTRAALLPQNLDYRESESPEAGFHGASILGVVYNLSTIVVGAGVAADAFGGAGRNILQACFVINNAGMLVVYMIIIDSLRYTSALSVGLAVLFVAITAGVAIVKLMEGKIGMPRLMPNRKLFTTVPVLVTAYVCHHNNHILDDVLANFDGDLGIPCSSLLDDLIRLSYCLHLMLVFPIVFFSFRRQLLFPCAIPKRRFVSVTVALMGFIFMGANFVPSIWDAFQFTGATAAVCVSYIFPAVITLRDTHGIATKNDGLISWMMIFLAVSTSTVAVTSDIYGT
ncbi:hypothetical protein V6N11_017874 [Hibiscus sabdariffa]|uniref:Amino acid transporter transmembrane domain-containing protein n=1 Tax=Hibiscus sabdariffa TaxID=183260 RepID=A0ABR2T5R8_9ROSI